MKERFLPIGTIVQVKDAKRPIMITSYCIIPTGNQIQNGNQVPAEKKIYEYGGCIYPQGIIDKNTIVYFNHNQIERIIFMGYETEEYVEFSKDLSSGFEIYKEKYEEKND